MKVYILDEDHNIVELETDEIGHRDFWRSWADDPKERCVAKTYHGKIRISTVFLSIDHRFGDEGPPILFETMVFGGNLDGEQRRYETWDQAVLGHENMVARVKRQGWFHKFLSYFNLYIPKGD